MFTLDKQTVIGALKSTGSKDPDVLYAKKSELIQRSQGLRAYSWIQMVVGVLLCFNQIGAFLGVPLVLLGLWLRRKMGENIKIADAALAQYLESIGVNTQSAAA
jgi:hypothetical protein